MSKKSGFTLIELLISISIIAILSAIGLVSYSVVMKQGRDSKRQADLRSIQSALEQYYADQFAYPDGIAFGSPLSKDRKTYLNTVPNDPTGSYLYTTTGSSYCLYANLENLGPAKPPTCNNPSYNFAVTPP